MMANTDLNIYQKLAKIRKPVEVLQKNKAGYGYTYVTEDEILAKVTGGMDKLGVSLIPNIVHGTTKLEPYTYVKTDIKKDKTGAVQKIDKNVIEFLTQADLEFIWVNNDNPEDRIIVPWTLIGTSATDASQSLGSGLTYATRYFLLKYFNVATPDDDPDNWRSKQQEAANHEEREVVAKILEEVDSIARAILAVDSESKAEVTKTIKKFAKDGGKPSANYFVIADMATANALLAELTAMQTKYENKTEKVK